jgi:hypothetical protein
LLGGIGEERDWVEVLKRKGDAEKQKRIRTSKGVTTKYTYINDHSMIRLSPMALSDWKIAPGPLGQEE